MNLLTGAALLLLIWVVVAGYALVRAMTVGRMWFIGIDPVRSESPLFFWYCFACMLLAFVGGTFGVFVLISAVL